MAYLKRLANGMTVEMAPGSTRLGGLGWDTQYLPVGATREGHEILTRNAFGPLDASGNATIPYTVGGAAMGRILSRSDQSQIMLGNTDTDIQYLRTRGLARGAAAHAFATLSPDEQKHHALRRNLLQSQVDALNDIIGDVRSQHAAVLAEPNPTQQLRRIGALLHLIQDSYSPAHMVRQAGMNGCISYIRNYGPANLTAAAAVSRIWNPNEHGFPTDERDQVSRNRAAAANAAAASRTYMQIAFKAIYGRNSGDAVATREAATDLGRFIAGILRRC